MREVGTALRFALALIEGLSIAEKIGQRTFCITALGSLPDSFTLWGVVIGGWNASRCRLNVWIQAEHVRWVILVLQGDKPIIVFTVGCPDLLGFVVAGDVVDVCAA